MECPDATMMETLESGPNPYNIFVDPNPGNVAPEDTLINSGVEVPLDSGN